jgi:hypothetical protein
MKKQFSLIFILSVLFIFILAMAMAVYAQEPQGEVRGSEEGGISDLGLADPPPAGFTVLYLFSGARDNTSSATAATSVHCTNYSSTSVQVRIQIFNFSGSNTMNGSFTLSASRSATFSTQLTALYFDDVVLTPATTIDQGSGRILVNNSAAKIICTAQVLDPTNNPPSYGVKLNLYDTNGILVSPNNRKTFLPTILKQ